MLGSTRIGSQHPDPPPRILLIHPGALGDLIQALPAFGAIRSAFPAARMTLLTDASLAPLALGTGLVDAVEVFDGAVAYHGPPAARLRLLASLAAGARRARPDVVAVFKGAPVYAALAAASGAKRRAGLARGVGRLLLTYPIPPDPSRHHEDRYLDVAEALGADRQSRREAEWPRRPPPVPPPGGAGWPLIGLAPGGARNAKQDTSSKRWAASRYAQLAAELLAEFPEARFVLLGGPGDGAEIDAVRGRLPADRVTDLAGRTDVAGARAAIAAADVYVGNDSGLMHVAGTTDTPAVIPFGPTDPRILAPRTGRVTSLWSPAGALPCYSEVAGRQQPCRTPCCIDRVSVAHVRAAVVAALRTARPGGTA